MEMCRVVALEWQLFSRLDLFSESRVRLFDFFNQDDGIIVIIISADRSNVYLFGQVKKEETKSEGSNRIIHS